MWLLLALNSGEKVDRSLESKFPGNHMSLAVWGRGGGRGVICQGDLPLQVRLVFRLWRAWGERVKQAKEIRASGWARLGLLGVVVQVLWMEDSRPNNACKVLFSKTQLVIQVFQPHQYWTLLKITLIMFNANVNICHFYNITAWQQQQQQQKKVQHLWIMLNHFLVES